MVFTVEKDIVILQIKYLNPDLILIRTIPILKYHYSIMIVALVKALQVVVLLMPLLAGKSLQIEGGLCAVHLVNIIVSPIINVIQHAKA